MNRRQAGRRLGLREAQRRADDVVKHVKFSVQAAATATIGVIDCRTAPFTGVTRALGWRIATESMIQKRMASTMINQLQMQVSKHLCANFYFDDEHTCQEVKQ